MPIFGGLSVITFEIMNETF